MAAKPGEHMTVRARILAYYPQVGCGLALKPLIGLPDARF
jgi:hypothetical protein